MSKVTFRARQIDYNKPLTVIRWNQPGPPDPSEYTSMLKSSTSVSTGMEKEEETEYHLRELLGQEQRVLSDIPVPDITPLWDMYDRLYPEVFEIPSTYLSSDAAGWLDDEPIDYDMDEEDEESLRGCTDLIPPIIFEKLMDCFEKGCTSKCLRYEAAVTSARSIQEVIPAQVTFVFDRWLNKRIRRPSGLLFRLKQECHDTTGKSANDPYVAFRRRSEKMQTRKNRKNDEHAYEKMFHLGQHLRYLQKIVQDVYLRESCKEKLDRKEMEITRSYLEHPNLLYEHQTHLLKSLKVSRSLYAHNPLSGVARKRTIDNHSMYKKMWRAKDKNKKRKLNEFSGPNLSDDSNIFDSSSDHEFEFVRKPGIQYERPRAEVSSPIRDVNMYTPLVQNSDDDQEITKLPFGARLRYGRNSRLILDNNSQGTPVHKRSLFAFETPPPQPCDPVSSQKLCSLLKNILTNGRLATNSPVDLISKQYDDTSQEIDAAKSSSSNSTRLPHCDSGTGSRPNSPENMMLLSPESEAAMHSPPRDVEQEESDGSPQNSQEVDCDVPFVHSNLRSVLAVAPGVP